MAEDTINQTSSIKDLVAQVNELLLKGEPANISVDTYSHYTGYKPQYVVDAMNEVLGIGHWGFEEISSELTKDEKESAILIVAKVKVWIAGVDFQPSAWGQNRITKGDIGDARKGAQTDAMKKALSYFSVGNRAFYGQLPDKKEQNAAQAKKREPENRARPAAANQNQPTTSTGAGREERKPAQAATKPETRGNQSQPQEAAADPLEKKRETTRQMAKKLGLKTPPLEKLDAAGLADLISQYKKENEQRQATIRQEAEARAEMAKK